MTRVPLVVAGLFLLAFGIAPILAMYAGTLWTEQGVSLAAWRGLLASEADRTQMFRSLQLGLSATGVAALLGGGHAWLTVRTDLPGARWLAPLGIAPLAMPPILLAMGYADWLPATGFWPCAFLLGVSYAPFVAVLFARGLRAIDGRLAEAALLHRGRCAAERLVARLALPELCAGALFAFLFVLAEHGVPEFLSVKGKNWLTYAEGIFFRWNLRAQLGADSAATNAVVASLPLVLVLGLALFLGLRQRARTTLRGDLVALPVFALGRWRWPALLLPLLYLGLGVLMPVVVMARWAAGSTQRNVPMSVDTFVQSARNAVQQAGDDLLATLAMAAATALVLAVVALPLARAAARRAAWLDLLAAVPLTVPAVLLGIGLVRLYNRPLTGGFYDGPAMVVCGYAARFLPFAVLGLSSLCRRIPREVEEAGWLTGRAPLARAAWLHVPLLLPGLWAVACLGFVLGLRELDLAVVLPEGNSTIVRRLSNVVHFGGEDVGGALALMLLLLGALPALLTILLTGRSLRSLS
ncbi:MAG: iron ABC transporter permease [Planctomycetes bacterium]|nr:iron ABC transporter permease [Planctomycetota bacterium]